LVLYELIESEFKSINRLFRAQCVMVFARVFFLTARKRNINILSELSYNEIGGEDDVEQEARENHQTIGKHS